MSKTIDPAVILAMAETNLNVSQAANRLYMHRSTVIYHLDKIQEATGRDPRCFYDLCVLVNMVHTKAVADWNDARKRMADIDDQTMEALMRLGDFRCE